MGLPSPLRPLAAAPARSAVLTDFDGTLAPIVDDPATSAPLSGMVEALARVARRYALVGVVSGRPVSFLVENLGPDLALSGLYGLERWRDGARVEVDEVESWRDVVEEATARAGAELGPVVEAKGLSVTLHFRTCPERGEEIAQWAAGEAARSGLRVHQARASVELHPPLDIDKGTEVEALGAGMEAACFFGDDVGDLAAFGALDRLAGSGVHVARVAVVSDESPPELVDRADVVVEGPTGVLRLLDDLAAEAPSGSS
ncbi:MAG: trehalose-phosphatase [Actinomycetota bacterium]|nr:trehalose-phosphatase [Actinomycetota bacterium]